MNKIYKPNEFSKMIGRTVNTLQRWDREGILKARRTPTNRRYYTDDFAKASKKRKEVEEILNNVVQIKRAGFSQFGNTR